MSPDRLITYQMTANFREQSTAILAVRAPL